MIVWTVVGLVVFAGLALVVMLMLLLDLAHKAIDKMKLDPERL